MAIKHNIAGMAHLKSAQPEQPGCQQGEELHPNTSNNHVDIIGTEMWPQICYKLKIP
jgi:hypothetical protein